MRQSLRTWILTDDGYAGDPVLCVDAGGRAWIAWISWDGTRERVKLSRLTDGEWGAPSAVTDPRSAVRGLAMASLEEGIALAWIDDGNPEHDGLKAMIVDPEGTRGPSRLVAPARRIPADVALASRGGAYALSWSERVAGGRVIEMSYGDDPSEACLARRVSSPGGFDRRVAVAVCGAGIWSAWQREQGGRCQIVVRTPDGSLVEVSRAVERGRPSGISACPSLAPAAGGEGVWVAWQSDLDPEVGPGLVRWTEVAMVGGAGEIYVPREPMPGVARQGEGEDQGFEAPTPVVAEDGRLILVGRGSQSLRVQSLSAGGWSDLERVDDEGWKCRGRRYAACVVDGKILVAGREKGGITVRLLPLDGEGGAPDVVALEPPEPSRRAAHGPGPHSPVEVAGHRVCFGDIHQHTMASDGTGTLEETFFRARHRYGDEICAVADHESFLGKRTPPGEWAELRRLADEASSLGEFVTLPAYEWTGKMHPGPGHKVGYPHPRGGGVLSRDDAPTSTSAGLVKACRRTGALLFPHHVGWTGADMDSHDPLVQTCWEIVSCHGAYERLGVGPIGTRGDDKEGQFIGDALDAGLRFGFVGGSDGHGLNWHHGVCRVRDSHRSGLTAVFVDELSREAVFEALASRRCYATSGAKIGVWFEVDGRPMGEEIPVTESVRFVVRVRPGDIAASVALISNGGEEMLLDGGSTSIDVSGTLPVPEKRGWSYYYVKVVREDGQVAWSSPIWLDAPGSPGSGLPAA